MKKIIYAILILLLSNNIYAECNISQNNFDRRIEFVQNYQRSLVTGLNEFQQKLNESEDYLGAMETAHNVSDVCSTVAAAAGLAAGGLSIAATYFAGGTFTFMGGAITLPNSVGYLYNGIKVAKGAYTITSEITDYLTEDETPEIALTNQVNTLLEQGFLTSRVEQFITNTHWSGSSTDLEHPSFNPAFDKLQDFYGLKIKEIDDNFNFWSYFG
jgi:hypothetical protein